MPYSRILSYPAIMLNPFWVKVCFAEDIRDIKPPLYFKTGFLPLAILGGLLFLAGLALLLKFILKRFNKKQQDALVEKIPADQLALQALQELSAEGLPAQGRIKEYYFRLSGIIRQYIENRFSIQAPEMTTEEFLLTLKDSHILSASHKDLLKQFLGLSDIVKFAKYGPSQKEIEESFACAVKFVQETRMVVEVPEASRQPQAAYSAK